MPIPGPCSRIEPEHEPESHTAGSGDARFDETGEALFQAWLHRVMPFLDMSEALSQPEPGWFRGAVRRVLWR